MVLARHIRVLEVRDPKSSHEARNPRRVSGHCLVIVSAALSGGSSKKGWHHCMLILTERAAVA